MDIIDNHIYSKHFDVMINDDNESRCLWFYEASKCLNRA